MLILDNVHVANEARLPAGPRQRLLLHQRQQLNLCEAIRIGIVANLHGQL